MAWLSTNQRVAGLIPNCLIYLKTIYWDDWEFIVIYWE